MRATLIAEVLVLCLKLQNLGGGPVRTLGLGRVVARPLLAALLGFGWTRWLAL